MIRRISLYLVTLTFLFAGPAEGGQGIAGLRPVEDSDFYDNGRFLEAKVELGRMLFFDKILSGNQTISCATCHHP